MIDNFIPRVRIYSEHEYLEACDWVTNHNLKLHEVGFYPAYNFGDIKFSNEEDFTYFMFCFEGKCIGFDPNGQDPDSISVRRS